MITVARYGFGRKRNNEETKPGSDIPANSPDFQFDPSERSTNYSVIGARSTKRANRQDVSAGP
jgi:hypothetical protein